MMIPRWLVRCAIWVPAILLFAFAAREFPVVVVFVTLVCGLAGLAYLVMRPRGSMPPLPDEQGQDRRDVERDIPPPPG